MIGLSQVKRLGGGFQAEGGHGSGTLEVLGVVPYGWDMVYGERAGSMRLEGDEAR